LHHLAAVNGLGVETVQVADTLLADTLKCIGYISDICDPKYHACFSSQNLARAQKALADAYLTAETNFVQNKINTVAALHTANQHSASWKVINEMGARKSTYQTQRRFY